MKTADTLYLALLAVLLLLDHFVLWRTFLRRSQVDPCRARSWLWSATMVMLWTLVAAGVAVWSIEARSWEVLGLGAPHGWRLWGTIILGSALAATYGRTIVRITRSKRPVRVKLGNPNVEKLTPHTRSELGLWVALSVTAGICEEFIFRGYLIRVFQPVLGLWAAAVLSVVVFALAHAYQGKQGVLATGIIGALFTLVVLATGSLLPAMALHALIDIGQGVIAWLAFRGSQVEGEPATGGSEAG